MSHLFVKLLRDFARVLRFFLDSAGVLVGLFALLTLLLDGVGVSVLLFFDVESLEETVKVQMLQIVRAEREFRDDELDVLVLELQFLEHGDEVLLPYSVFAILDVLEGCFELVGVGARHLRHSENHFLLFILVEQLKVVYHLSDLCHQDIFSELIALINILFLKAIGQKYFRIV